MTLTEKTICTAFTGINFCPGEEFSEFHAYAEKLMGRPIWTHEMADKEFWDKLHELSKEDFHKIVAGRSQKAEQQPQTCGHCKHWDRGACTNSHSPKFTDDTLATDGCTPNKKGRPDWI